MLDTSNCQDHFDEVIRTATGTGQKEKLDGWLKILDEYTHKGAPTTCKLFQYAAAPMSFVVQIYLDDTHVTSGALTWERNEEDIYDWQFHRVG